LEGQAYRAVLTEDLRCMVVEGDTGRLLSMGYGEIRDEKLILWPEEALFLIERGRLTLIGSGGAELDFRGYLSRISEAYPGFWPQYVIYRDLRQSGRVVRRGFGGRLAYRLYEPSQRESSKFVVLVFPEGTSLKVGELLRAARQVMRKGKVLVVAVLERRGEVIYYSCSDTTLSNL